ncbi:hypothetical protein UFOVP703_64 [uncultured Caudovirales phage]|uniref:Uncharacterized protein n=1 Tax=uncultured Caudovirales phage TaxID=2100421 RepID=A0A6J5NPT6_9CAUD|nr:hypothetical protein UFOVP703_64 [uncultured Caudovirales phage]
MFRRGSFSTRSFSERSWRFDGSSLSQLAFGLGDDDGESLRLAVQAHNNAVLSAVAALIELGIFEWER